MQTIIGHFIKNVEIYCMSTLSIYKNENYDVMQKFVLYQIYLSFCAFIHYIINMKERYLYIQIMF